MTDCIQLAVIWARSWRISGSDFLVDFRTWKEWSAVGIISRVGLGFSFFRIGRRRVRSARVSRVPWRKSMGVVTSDK